jgi:hypothetical protein
MRTKFGRSGMCNVFAYGCNILDLVNMKKKENQRGVWPANENIPMHGASHKLRTINLGVIR